MWDASNRDFLQRVMDAAGFGVNSGNFRMCSVNGGKIITAVELHDRNGASPQIPLYEGPAQWRGGSMGEVR